MKAHAVLASTTWMVISGSMLWMAVSTGWAVAWLAFALMSPMPALMLMVLAQTPGRTVGRIIHDPEPRSQF